MNLHYDRQNKKTDYYIVFTWRLLYTTLCDKVVSDLQQVGGFLWVRKFPPPIKLTPTIYILNIVESGVKRHTLINLCIYSVPFNPILKHYRVKPPTCRNSLANIMT
jgi:hypothetical protein